MTSTSTPFLNKNRGSKKLLLLPLLSSDHKLLCSEIEEQLEEKKIMCPTLSMTLIVAAVTLPEILGLGGPEILKFTKKHPTAIGFSLAMIGTVVLVPACLAAVGIIAVALMAPQLLFQL